MKPRMSFKYNVSVGEDFDYTEGRYYKTYDRSAFLTVTADTEDQCNSVLEDFKNYIMKNSDYYCWDGSQDAEFNEKNGKWVGDAEIMLNSRDEFEDFKELYKEWKEILRNGETKEEKVKTSMEQEKESIVKDAVEMFELEAKKKGMTLCVEVATRKVASMVNNLYSWIGAENTTPLSVVDAMIDYLDIYCYGEMIEVKLPIGSTVTNTNGKKYLVVNQASDYTIYKDLEKKMVGYDEYIVAWVTKQDSNTKEISWLKGRYFYEESLAQEFLRKKVPSLK